MAVAQIDHRIIERLIFAAMQTALSGTVSAYAPGEPLPVDATAWMQLEPLLITGKGCPGGGSSAPDSAEVTIRITVAVADSETRTDVFQCDTVASRVALAIRRTYLADAASGHEVEIGEATVDGDVQADESRRIRIASIIATGMAYRSSGTSLE